MSPYADRITQWGQADIEFESVVSYVFTERPDVNRYE